MFSISIIRSWCSASDTLLPLMVARECLMIYRSTMDAVWFVIVWGRRIHIQKKAYSLPYSLTYEFDPYDLPTSLIYKDDPRVWPTRMIHEFYPREWPTSLTYENGPRECLHEFHSRESPTRPMWTTRFSTLLFLFFTEKFVRSFILFSVLYFLYLW